MHLNIPTSGYPTAVTAEKAHYAADLRRAIEAYKFFFPTLGDLAP